MKLPSPGLEDKDKSKLIEILLIVGGILGVFKLPVRMLPLFIVFLFISVVYYISLHSKRWRKTGLYKFSAVFVSLTFSGVASSILGVAMVNSGIWIASFTALMYYVVFSFILFRALYK